MLESEGECMRCSKSACPPPFFFEAMGFFERLWRCLGGGGGGGGCGGIRCGVGQTCVRPTGPEDCLQRSRKCIRCYSYILGLECGAYGYLQ